MISIQHNLMDKPQGTTRDPVKQDDAREGFEYILADESQITAKTERIENLSTSKLSSDIQLDAVEQSGHLINDITSLRVQTEQPSEHVQVAPIHLRYEDDSSEISLDNSTLIKKKRIDGDLDGTEMNPSLMSFLVPTEVLSKPIPFTLDKVGGTDKSLRTDIEDKDSLVSVSSITSDFNRILPSINADSKEVTKDTSLPLAVSNDFVLRMAVSNDFVLRTQAVGMMPDTSLIGNKIDKPTITVKSNQPGDDDKLLDDVPIVSISLKRDPVMQGIPVKKSDFNIANTNEKLTLNLSPNDDAIQVSKSTDADEAEADSNEGNSENAERLLDTTLKEGSFKPVQNTVSTESLEVLREPSLSKSLPTQQLQQAILDAKEGVLVKESKTLTVVLNPEELGSVNVELTADDSGKLSAVLSVEKRETLDVLQQDLHQLKTVLREIGIDESSISLQLSSNNQQEHQKQSEYVAWEERELMLARSSHTSIKTTTVEKATYPERQSVRRLDIKA